MLTEVIDLRDQEDGRPVGEAAEQIPDGGDLLVGRALLLETQSVERDRERDQGPHPQTARNLVPVRGDQHQDGETREQRGQREQHDVTHRALTAIGKPRAVAGQDPTRLLFADDSLVDPAASLGRELALEQAEKLHPESPRHSIG